MRIRRRRLLLSVFLCMRKQERTWRKRFYRAVVSKTDSANMEPMVRLASVVTSAYFACALGVLFATQFPNRLGLAVRPLRKRHRSPRHIFF